MTTFRIDIEDADIALIEAFEESKVDLSNGALPRSVSDAVPAYIEDVLVTLRGRQKEAAVQQFRESLDVNPVETVAALETLKARLPQKPPVGGGIKLTP